MHAGEPRRKVLTSKITISVTTEVRKKFDAEAEALGLSGSDYGRFLLFETRRATDRKRLNQIGNLAVMIARALRRKDGTPSISETELSKVLEGE